MTDKMCMAEYYFKKFKKKSLMDLLKMPVPN